MQKARDNALSSTALQEKQRARRAELEEEEENEAEAENDGEGGEHDFEGLAGLSDTYMSEEEDDDDGFDGSMAPAGSSNDPPKKKRKLHTQPASNVPTFSEPAKDPLKEACKATGLTPAQQGLLQKASETMQKLKEGFGAEKMWEGSLRRRQVEAMSKSAAALSAKLGALDPKKCPSALQASESMMDEMADVEARFDAFAVVKGDPRTAIETLDPDVQKALLTCDMAVLGAMLSKIAADLLKQMDVQDSTVYSL